MKCSFWNFTITTNASPSKKCTRKQCPDLVESSLLHKFHGFCDIILSKEEDTMKPDIEKLRKKYMDNPPEGMSSRDIRRMSEEELLDMDYFLNDDELDDGFGEEGFYIF